MNEYSVVYVAQGETARLQAVESLKTLRPFLGSGVNVYVIGEKIPGTIPVEFKDERRGDQGGRLSKISMIKKILRKYVLYLDADTRVRQDITPGFDMIADGFDLVICPSENQGDELFWHISQNEINETVDQLGYNPLQLQAGVFFFHRNVRVREFFQVWREEYAKYNDQDQAAFIRALDRVPLKVWLLGRPWNGGAIIEHRFGACRK